VTGPRGRRSGLPWTRTREKKENNEHFAKPTPPPYPSRKRRREREETLPHLKKTKNRNSTCKSEGSLFKEKQRVFSRRGPFSPQSQMICRGEEGKTTQRRRRKKRKKENVRAVSITQPVLPRPSSGGKGKWPDKAEKRGEGGASFARICQI